MERIMAKTESTQFFFRLDFCWLSTFYLLFYSGAAVGKHDSLLKGNAQ